MSESETNTVKGLLYDAVAMDLNHPHAWERLGEILGEAKRIQEAVVSALDRSRFEQTWGQPLPLEQDDNAAAPEGPAMHPAFGLLTKQFMTPQAVRR